MLLVIWGQHRILSICVIVLADWFHCDASQKRETNRVHDGLLTLDVPVSVQVRSSIVYAVSTAKNLTETLKR
jgi:hypothetical protein